MSRLLVGIVVLLALGGCANPPEEGKWVGKLPGWTVTDMGCAANGLRLYVTTEDDGGYDPYDANLVEDETCEE